MALIPGITLRQRKIKLIRGFFQQVTIMALVIVSLSAQRKLAVSKQALFLNHQNAGLQMKSLVPKIGKVRSSHPAHTDNTQHGMGDFYGSGVRNPIGKMRSDSVGYRPASKKQLGTPPKSVV